ncbi:MAG: S9 family peptidase [Bacteroidetes bacterium]|nr:S9 family peptidase [Bacteroidota bacterium]
MRFSFLLILSLLVQTAFAQKKSITLEDIWQKGTFRIKSVPGFNAMDDGTHYTDIVRNGQERTIQIKSIVDGTAGEVLYQGNLDVDDYEISPKRDKLLLRTQAQNIYRRSVLYRVYLYDIKSKNQTLLDTAKVLHASFSPDGTKVAFVKNNNLFYKDLKSEEVVQVSSDGAQNKIINGNCDWVYEEEFEFTKAYQWSPDSKHLAYYHFDETNVPEYTMTKYDNLYPTPYKYKYPVAGEPNSIVEILIYDLAGKTVARPELSNEDGTMDYYIPRIKWSNDPARLCVYKLNRRQNELNLYLANAKDGKTEKIYSETNKAFIEINDNLQFLPDGHSFLFNSEQDGWNHLYTWDWKAKKLTLLTKGDYDIDALIGTDAQVKYVYYTAAVNSPLVRNLYRVELNGKNRKTLTPQPGFHAITPINGNRYFLDKYSQLNAPPVYSLLDAEGKSIRILEDNADLKKTMAEFNLGKVEFTQVEVADKVELNAWRILPPNFDPSKKYPVLLYQYSGPNSQEVADRFPVRDYFWHNMLAEKGYIIYCVDGTGTGFRGEAFRKKTYLQLGKYESDDQIAVAKHLGTLPYVDAGRIGIWGWSFGGFMSSTCIMKGADVFKMAIAVAPVTNWRYYDNIYTERYMRMPSENEAGYDENAPEKMTAKLKGKFLLIHGTGDDNVHFQNSVALVNHLISDGKEFDAEYYPDRTHGISGGNTRMHLYQRMTNFILSNL